MYSMKKAKREQFLEWAQALRYNTSIGGYPLFALTADGGILCPHCCRENAKRIVHETVFSSFPDEQWTVVAVDVHWEGSPLQCDNCYESIDSAYGDPWALDGAEADEQFTKHD